jgi:DNA-binding NarL/FixJ family response regulator
MTFTELLRAEGELDLKSSEFADAVWRVLIVDRDPMSSDLLARALEHERICRATALRSDGLLSAISESQAKLVVIGADLRTQHGDGFALAEEVGRAIPNVFIVLLLTRPSRESVINAFRAGARGVFPRERPITDFLDCVERVKRGFLWVAGPEVAILLQAFRNIPAPNVLTALNGPSLTDRELQVVRHAATGKTNRAIAQELSLSEHTVKNYMFKAFEKLGVSSRIELLFYLTLAGHAVPKMQPGNVAADSLIEDKAPGESWSMNEPERRATAG